MMLQKMTFKKVEETGQEGTKQVAIVSDTQRKCMVRPTLVDIKGT